MRSFAHHVSTTGPSEDVLGQELRDDPLVAGLSPTAAAKELAKRTGLPRGDPYDMVRRAKGMTRRV